MLRIITEVQGKIKREIANKIPYRSRVKRFVVFVDLRKAFDTIRRDILLQSLHAKGIDPNLIQFIRQTFAMSKLQFRDLTETSTNIGVVQGGVLSPTCFAHYINELLGKLN